MSMATRRMAALARDSLATAWPSVSPSSTGSLSGSTGTTLAPVLVSTPEVEFEMDDVRGFYEERDRYQLVDVREPWEWQEGRIEGAVLIPLNDVMAGAEQGHLDKERPVVLVCKSGNRSEVATLMLRARGYDAHNLEGGMLAWDAEGLPYTTHEGKPGRVA